MLYLLQELTAWLFAGLALGLVVGAATCAGERRNPRAGWPSLALFFCALGVVAAFLRLLPGRAGLWLETSLLLGAAYVVGCLLGCFLRSLFAARLPTAKPIAEAPESSIADEAPAALGAAVKPVAEAAEALAAAAAAAQKRLANDNIDSAAAKTGATLASDFVEGAKSLDGQAAALAAATPAALAAASEAQKLLAGDADALATTAPAPTIRAPSDALSEDARTFADHAAALAAATPAALAAAGEVQELLAGDKSGEAVAQAEPPVQTDAPSDELSEGAKILADHAAALAAMTPAALAAASEAQKLLAGDAAASVTTAPAPTIHAPSDALSEDARTFADHAQALAAATPAVLAAAGEAQELLAGDKSGEAVAQAEPPVQTDAPSDALSEGAKILADHAAALAAMTPAALAAASEAQKLLAGDAAASATTAPAPTIHAPSDALTEDAKTFADHAAALAAATPAALAASGEAQNLLGDKSEDAGAKAEAVAPMQAPSSELSESAETLAGHAAAFAAASEAQRFLTADQGEKAETLAPATKAPSGELEENAKALADHGLAPGAGTPAASTSASQASFAKREAPALSPPPAAERPAREEDEDKLGQIEGVGKKLTRKLHEIGVWRFEQIAAWTPEQAAWVGARIGEPGRVESENWIAQARLLAEAGKIGTRVANGGQDKAIGTPSPGEKAEAVAPEDDLRLIRGIGERISGELHDLGIRRFSQIAAWTPAQQDWIGERLGHSGPVARKFWVAQARLLAGGVETGHSGALRDYDGADGKLDEAAAAVLHAALPEVIAPHANDEIYAGVRPLSLLQPPNGEMDDLSVIEGVGDQMAERLHGLGIWTFEQIARWSDENARWIGSYLAFPGRVQRERWIEQAVSLAAKKRTTS